MLPRLLSLLLLLGSFSFTVSASSQRISLINEARKAKKFFASRNFNHDTCSAVLMAIYPNMRNLDFESVDIEEVKKENNKLVQELFDARMILQRRLQIMAEHRRIGDDCLTEVKRIDNAFRYVIDYVIGAFHPGIKAEKWVNNSYQPVRFSDESMPFETGDVIISRGDAISSAGIAHFGRVDGEFSHNVLVYKHLVTGKIWTIESYIEKGVIVQGLEDYLKSGVGRFSVIRHRNRHLAREAGETAYNRVKDGKKIYYDNAFNTFDHSELFCSELISWAYGENINRERKIPYYLSEFPLAENPRLFESMGINNSVFYAPSDVATDPQFDIIAEYREVDRLGAMRVQNVVADRLYKWMEEEQYVIEPTLAIKAFLAFGLGVRKLPLLGKLLEEMVSPKASLKFLNVLYTIDLAGRKLFDKLDSKRKEGEARLGRPMLYDELFELAETIKQQDHDLWELKEQRLKGKNKEAKKQIRKNRKLHKKEEILFHDLFRPVR